MACCYSLDLEEYCRPQRRAVEKMSTVFSTVKKIRTKQSKLEQSRTLQSHEPNRVEQSRAAQSKVALA